VRLGLFSPTPLTRLPKLPPVRLSGLESGFRYSFLPFYLSSLCVARAADYVGRLLIARGLWFVLKCLSFARPSRRLFWRQRTPALATHKCTALLHRPQCPRTRLFLCRPSRVPYRRLFSPVARRYQTTWPVVMDHQYIRASDPLFFYHERGRL